MIIGRHNFAFNLILKLEHKKYNEQKKIMNFKSWLNKVSATVDVDQFAGDKRRLI